MSQSEQFASDNYSGVCPQAWKAMEAANRMDEPAYGEDSWTQKAADGLRTLFDTDCDVYFVFNGTAANSLALASIGQSFHSVICHELAHIETDECGGPEYASNGAKLLLGQGENGKLTPESIEHLVTKRTDIHYPKPKALSLTQATEVGTVYTPDELRVIREVADRHRLNIHMDGARFANAVAALDVHPSEITWKAGVDVLCFSGTKNGLALGEAVVFFNRSLAEDFEWRCKQAGQLASKMRYLGTLVRASGRRCLVGECPPCQCLCTASCRGFGRASRYPVTLSEAGERCFCGNAGLRAGSFAGQGVALLQLYRWQCPPDVFLGYEH